MKCLFVSPEGPGFFSKALLDHITGFGDGLLNPIRLDPIGVIIDGGGGEDVTDLCGEDPGRCSTDFSILRAQSAQ